MSALAVGRDQLSLLEARIAGWVVLLERGAAYVSWAGKSVHSLDSTMESPHGVFLRAGRLVLISGTEGRVWSTTSSGLACAGTFAAPAGAFFALTAGSENGEFVLWQESGAATRWTLA